MMVKDGYTEEEDGDKEEEEDLMTGIQKLHMEDCDSDGLGTYKFLVLPEVSQKRTWSKMGF